jgi:hypothetical protein
VTAAAGAPAPTVLAGSGNFSEIPRQLGSLAMPIEVVPHSEVLRAAVEDLNRRMREGGSQYGMYPDPVPDWVPKIRDDQKVWREYWIAVEDKRVVRGGFALKPQQWLIHGQVRMVTDWQGPFSEAVYDPKYAMLGLRLMRDMQKRQPLLYAWGSYGRPDDPMAQMLKKIGWTTHATPLAVRVLHPYRFLRRNRYLRGERRRALLLDALALSGAGSVGLRVLHAGLRASSARRFPAQAELVPRFDTWADTLWERCKDAYTAIAIRDSDAMNTLLPERGWPQGHRLRVRHDGRDLGWVVVMDTHMHDDARFGDLRVGSVVDCLAQPDDAGAVVAAATRFLKRRGVDLIISNQAHPAWTRAFRDNGYVLVPKQRYLTASPELQTAFAPFEATVQGLHMTNMDGHGPMLL